MQYTRFQLASLRLWGGFFLLFGFYLLFNLQIICHSEIVLPRDSANYALEAFWYVGKVLQETGNIPLYIPSEGGVPLALVSNNYLLLAPWKIAGYLAVMAGADVNTSFKASFFFGQFLLFIGIFLLYRELFHRSLICLFLLFITIFSGLGFGNYHQEQSLASLFWVPYILLFLLRGAKEEKPYYTVLAIALFGASLNLHYPHIPFFGIGAFLLGFLLTGNKEKVFPKTFKKDDAFNALLFFFLLSSPLAVAYFQYAGDYASPFRNTSDIATSSFQQYSSIHFLSQPFHELFQYLGVHPLDHSEGMDNFPFYIGLLPVFFLPFLFRKRSINKACPFLLSSLLLFLLFMGISSFLPLLLYSIPGVSLFRQWYHFHPLFTLSLLLLSGYALEGFFACRSEKRALLFYLQRGGLFFLLLALLSVATGEFNSPLLAQFFLWLLVFSLLSMIKKFRFLLLSFLFFIALQNGQYAYEAVKIITSSVAPKLSETSSHPLSSQDFSSNNRFFPLNDSKLVADKKLTTYRKNHPDEHVLLSKMQFFDHHTGALLTPKIQFKRKLPGNYRFEIESRTAIDMVLTAPFSPHWEASISHIPLRVLNLENSFTGLSIPKGKQNVELRFKDPLWQISLLLHFASLFILLPSFYFRKRREWKKNKGN